MKKRMAVGRLGWLVAAALGLGLTAGSGVFVWRGFAPPPARETIKPSRGTVTEQVVANGSIIPRKEVRLKAQVSGVLEEILVTPGTLVKAGEVVARIRLVPNPLTVSAAEFAVEKAKLEVDRAATDVKRLRALRRTDAVSQSEAEDAEHRAALAGAEWQAARKALELTLRGESVGGDRFNNRVVATLDGMVLDRPVEEGDHVIETNTFNEGTTIMTIADMGQMLFRGTVDETDAGRLTVGDELTIRIGALEDRTFRASLEYIAPKGTGPGAERDKPKGLSGTLEDIAHMATVEDGVTRFEIRAGLKLRPDAFVRAGYSATAEVVLRRKENVLTVEERQLATRDGQTVVLVEVAPGRFVARPVKVGLSDGLTAEIVEGLDGSETLLADPGDEK